MTCICDYNYLAKRVDYLEREVITLRGLIRELSIKVDNPPVKIGPSPYFPPQPYFYDTLGGYPYPPFTVTSGDNTNAN